MVAKSAGSQIQSGRLFRRIPLSVQVEVLEPGVSEVGKDAVTENVSPSGARVRVGTPMQPDALVVLKSPMRKFGTSVRVVYCEPLLDGQFGVGLQLDRVAVDWTNYFTDSET